MNRIQLSKKDRLFLINQYKILAQVSKDADEVDYYQNCITILENGYEFHYHELDQLISDPMSAEDSSEILDILSMFRVLNDSYTRLKDKSGIEEWWVTFRGFDGNYEATQMGYVGFLAKQGGRYFSDILTGDGYNSHCPSLDRYRKMLEHLRRNFPNSQILTKEQIIEVAEAGLSR